MAGPQVTSSSAADQQSQLAQLEAKIGEHCDNVTWVTTSIFLLSIFLSILRPDPTLTICLFGFYGAHVRSAGAIRTFWFFMLVSVGVDLLWLFIYSPMRPIAFDTMMSLSRKDQVRTKPTPHFSDFPLPCPLLPELYVRISFAR